MKSRERSELSLLFLQHSHDTGQSVASFVFLPERYLITDNYRKRAVDIVRQAQFAAFSYLGFNPYEQNCSHGFRPQGLKATLQFARDRMSSFVWVISIKSSTLIIVGMVQVTTSEPSEPMEFHLHHHRHHHYAENFDTSEKPSHIQASLNEIPLGVGSLFSVCNHKPVLRGDGRNAYREVDDGMWGNTSNGFWIKGKSCHDQDEDFANYYTRFSSQTQKGERTIGGNLSGAENGWSVNKPGVYQVVVNDLQHATATRYSTGHWKCTVSGDSNLARSLHIEDVEQATKKENFSNSTETNEMMEMNSLDLAPTLRYYSSYFTPTHKSSLLDSPQSSNSNLTFAIESYRTDSERKFGIPISNQKKACKDNLDMNEIHLDLSNMGMQHFLDSRECSYTTHVGDSNRNRVRDGVPGCEASVQPSKQAVLTSHNLLSSEQNSAHAIQGNNTIQMTSGKVANAFGSTGQQNYPSFEHCNSQRLLPLHMPTKCQGSEEVRFHMTVDLVKDSDSTYHSRQKLLRDKIITLDVVEERSIQSIPRDSLVGSTTESSTVRHDLTTAGDCIHKTTSSISCLHPDKERILDFGMHGMLNSSSQSVEEMPMSNAARGKIVHRLECIAEKKAVGGNCSMGCHSDIAQSNDLEHKQAEKSKRPRAQLNEVQNTVTKKHPEAQLTSYCALALMNGTGDKCESQYVQVPVAVNVCKNSIQDIQEGLGVSQSYVNKQHSELEKKTNRFPEKELDDARTNFEIFLRDLEYVQEASMEQGSLSQAVALLQEREKSGLMRALEADFAAKEKTHISKILKEAAGDNAQCYLVDERVKTQTRPSEELLKHKSAGTLRSEHLFLEKMKLESTEAKNFVEGNSVNFTNNEKVTINRSNEALKEGLPQEILANAENDKVHEEFVIFEKPKTGQELSRHTLQRNATNNKKSQCPEVPRLVQNMGSSFQWKKKGSISRQKGTDSLKLVKREPQIQNVETDLEDVEKQIEHLKINKSTLQENLKRMHSYPRPKSVEMGVKSGCLDQDALKSYDYVYQSPIFEEWRSNEGGFERKNEDIPNTACQKSENAIALSYRRCKLKDSEKVLEIQQLSEELRNLKAKMMSCKENTNSLCFAEQQACGAATTESSHLKINLDNTKQQIAEEETSKNTLTERLEETHKHSYEIFAHANELRATENTSCQTHHLNLQLINYLANAETRLSELQKHYDGLLLTVDSQLKEAKLNAEGLKAIIDELQEKLNMSEKKALEFRKFLENKDIVLHECKRSLQALLTEKDTLKRENAELLSSLQQAKKEADDQKLSAAEYLSINEELLDFAQMKENQVTDLKQQIQCLQQILEKNSGNAMLGTDLKEGKEETIEMRKRYHALEVECNRLKSRLAESNLHLVQHEGTIGKLTRQITDIMQGRDTMLEEAAQFHGYLQNARYREFELEKELRDSKLNTKNFEEKLQNTELEASRMRSELADVKKYNSLMQRDAEAKSQEVSEMKKEVEELRKKIENLEEEVMEKEGQIAILKSSFPEESDSGF